MDAGRGSTLNLVVREKSLEGGYTYIRDTDDEYGWVRQSALGRWVKV